ncbi:1,2-phenylacetyl-CoA epoxidase subunit PaaC [Nocardia miyunensis]|uniref:1,2-phenylacetyl-CoA epoxidase subunit PaaC n=1 Tax=Nocardia miyunensis TaxID=282684 RepID=UPI00082F660E|nr:1,2-phenylacetyl-CoA epoxidase subunit PaaC [Nocardia miyunensis]
MIDHDNAYTGLLGGDDHDRWAFGGDFDDPLAGIDTSVPEGVDRATLARYCLMLADDALVSAQRLTQWCTRAPELEEEVALANIGLDLLGQARLLYARAAAADPAVVPTISASLPVPAEDALAFFRDAADYRNAQLCEVANGDFAHTVVRMLIFVTWRTLLFDRLRDSADPVLSAIAHKGLKELTYHRDYAARWIVVLGNGTEESRRRTDRGLTELAPYLAELFADTEDERALTAAGIAVEPSTLRADFDTVMATILKSVGQALPAANSEHQRPVGHTGEHLDDLSVLLDEMQSVARAHPEGRW